jgi:hypothetical protein
MFSNNVIENDKTAMQWFVLFLHQSFGLVGKVFMLDLHQRDSPRELPFVGLFKKSCFHGELA